jgi:hypothetical protein
MCSLNILACIKRDNSSLRNGVEKMGKGALKTGRQEGAWRQIDKMKEEKGRTQIPSTCGIIASQHVATKCA